MPALSFPASPTVGQTYSANGRTWSWTGYAWELVAASSGGSGEDALLRSIFVPAAPTGLTVTAGNTSATLAWTAPTGVIAQAPITDYSEQYSTDNGTTWTTVSAAASTATTATIGSLTNGQSVRFRVAAVNAVGTGAYTAASAAVTPAVASDADFTSVQLLLHMEGTGSTFVDSSVAAKTITAAGNATQSTSQSKFGSKSAAFDGTGDYLSVPSVSLSGDFAFEGWIRWVGGVAKDYSAIALGGSNSQMFLTTKQDRTGLRFGLTGVTQYATGSFTWAADTWYHFALSRSGSAINMYVNGNNVTDGSPTNATSFSGELRLGGDGTFTYDSNIFLDDVRLTVGSSRGYTGATITVPAAAFPDFGPISAPTSLAATRGNGQASLTWTDPSYNGGSAITDYSVQYSTNSGSTWTTFSRTASTTASQVVTGLTNGTAYVFRVAGINSNGTGTYTAASSSVTPATMATVTGGTVTTPGDGYRYHTFTTSGTLAISSSALTADVLVVGAGGAGGRNFGGGGGGGGGVLYQTSQSIATGSYEVTVAPTAAVGSSGTASSIGSLYSATGGAAGGTVSGGAYGANSGGSSGVPTSSSNSTANGGGSGATEDGGDSGGQGGGAGAIGVAGQAGTQVNSGNGRSVFGSTYGVGGRGGLNGVSTAYNGSNNTGNGGSGGGDGFSNSGRGTGGSGVVIVRYLVA